MLKERGKKSEQRSGCPVSCTLELIGDKWSLLIVRDMMFFGKSTYNEFLESNEKISTNILNDRLVSLNEKGIITYTGSAKRKKYQLTKTGYELMPVIEAMVKFGLKHFKGNKKNAKKLLKEFSG